MSVWGDASIGLRTSLRLLLLGLRIPSRFDLGLFCCLLSRWSNALACFSGSDDSISGDFRSDLPLGAPFGTGVTLLYVGYVD